MRINLTARVPNVPAWAVPRHEVGRSATRVVSALLALLMSLGSGLVSGAGVAAASEGAVPAADTAVLVSPPLAAAPPRPRNGSVLLKRGSGVGRLEVDNFRDPHDTKVTLAHDGRASLIMYVHGGSRAQVSGIPDGSFEVFIERLGASSSSARMSRIADFRAQQVARATRFSRVTLTLYPVVGGNTSLTPVPEETVPR